MAHILVIEDDAGVRTALLRGLEDRGHAVRAASSGMAGLTEARTREADLVVLDLGLPDVAGIEVLRMLRAVSRVPVLVLTARDEEPQIVGALDHGADDYVVKPCGVAQLDARIRAVLRRVGDETRADTITIGELRIDPAARTVKLSDRDLDLAAREFELLLYLAERRGQVVSKSELLSQVWQYAYRGADKTVDVHVSWLRRKLGESAKQPRYLRTVRRAGVKLVPPEEE